MGSRKSFLTNCGKEEQEVGPGKQNVIVRNACPLDSRFFFVQAWVSA